MPIKKEGAYIYCVFAFVG